MQPMFLDANMTMAIGMGVFLLAMIAAAGFFMKKKLSQSKNQRQAQVLLRLHTPHTEKEIPIKFPPSGLYEYQRGENDILPIYLDPKWAKRDSVTGDTIYHACEATGRQYRYVTPHPKTDEEAAQWLENDRVKKILDGGLVSQFVKQYEDPWWTGLAKYLPWVMVVVALFALPQVISGMRSAMGMIWFGVWT
jgi:hypothetical protein